MEETKLAKLKEHIALPQWEKRLRPLFLFKGTKPYHLRAMFNVAYVMYLEECASFSEAVRLFNSPQERFHHKDGKPCIHFDGKPTEIGHLCGRHAATQHSSLNSFFWRLRSDGGIQLTDSIDKGFSEYIEWISPGGCPLTPVSINAISHGPVHDGLIGWWRQIRRIPRRPRPRAEPLDSLQYPFVKSQVRPEQQLLVDVHKMIPRSIPAEIRGDLCQDLLVAILSGETTVENIPNVMHKYAKQARKIMPDRWKTVSLDAPVPGTNDLRVGDNLEVGCDHLY